MGQERHVSAMQVKETRNCNRGQRDKKFRWFGTLVYKLGKQLVNLIESIADFVCSSSHEDEVYLVTCNAVESRRR